MTSAKTSSATREPWYFAYSLVGAVVAGLIPIVLPLRVADIGNASHVGLIMAALSLGQLGAPLWGSLADTLKLHRILFMAGLVVVGVSLGLFLFTRGAYVMAALTLTLGLGISLLTTLASLFVVERFPKETWGLHLANLQRYYSLGQVAGLVLAGLLSLTHLRLGLLLAGFIPLIALRWTVTLPRLESAKTVTLSPRAHEPLYASFGHFRVTDVGRAVIHLRRRPFTTFLLAWLLENAGAACLFAFYPLLMNTLYNVSATFSSWTFAAAVAVSLPLFRAMGGLITRLGAARVMQLGLLTRTLTFASLVAVTLLSSPSTKSLLALTLFAVTVLAWSFISVSSATLAGGFGLPEGEAIGLYNATAALANSFAAFLGGWLAHSLGYEVLPLAAAIIMFLSVLAQRTLIPARP